MNAIDLYRFLVDHPDWSPVLHAYGKSGYVGCVGLIAPQGRFFRLGVIAEAIGLVHHKETDYGV